MPALPAWAPYVAPIVLSMALTWLEAQSPARYPLLYGLKIALTAAVFLVTYALARPRMDATPTNRRWLVAATLLGLPLAAAWVLVDQITPHVALLGQRLAYDPFAEIPDAVARAGFITARFAGLVLVAPVVEEYFYRGFILRLFTDVDHPTRVPAGRFSWGAAAICTALFALAHPEWLAAALFSIVMCLLLARTRSLHACVLAHASTNLALGLYVLAAQQWQYW